MEFITFLKEELSAYLPGMRQRSVSGVVCFGQRRGTGPLCLCLLLRSAG